MPLIPTAYVTVVSDCFVPKEQHAALGSGLCTGGQDLQDGVLQLPYYIAFCISLLLITEVVILLQLKD